MNWKLLCVGNIPLLVRRGARANQWFVRTRGRGGRSQNTFAHPTLLSRTRITCALVSICSSLLFAATDRIIANPGTLTGSIGVIMETANVEGLLKKIGVEGIVVKSGKFKDVGSPLRKMTAEEQALLQAVMDDVHQQFIEAVAEGRALEPSTVQALADGRIFTGRQAKDAKLVDELGNLDDAIQLAADLAGIEGEPKVIEPRRRFSFREFIDSRLSMLIPKLDFYAGVSFKYLMAF